MSRKVLDELGITPNQSDAVSSRVDAIRLSWRDAASTPGFFHWPEQLHGEYQRDREASPLGRIFRIANGMHDEIDAVVVVGSWRALAAIRALVHACCDPLHNELTRAQRGSKPRIYFAGDSLDNDTVRSLLQRLTTNSSESVPDRWAVVAISEDGENPVQSIVLAHLLEALTCVLGSNANELLGRYFIPFARSGSWLHDLGKTVGCQEIFEVDFGAAEPTGALALANHLPAAMLGLDCMRWLGGAFELNQHFLNEPFDRNSVLKYFAATRLLETCGPLNLHSLNVWSDALESWGHWYKNTVPVCHATHVLPRDFSRRSPGENEELNLYVTTRLPRADLLKYPTRFLVNNTSGSDVSGENDSIVAGQFDGYSLRLVMPVIDTFSMGQLFQMVMIAAEVDRQLRPNTE